MSNGRIRQLYEFRSIAGVNRNPSSNEDGKLPVWNNSSDLFDFKLVGEGNIDTTYLTNFVDGYLKSTTVDDFVTSIIRIPGTNTARFTRIRGAVMDLPLGALAWLDTVTPTIALPGNTRVLFDDNSVIGGSANFLFNKATNRLQFTDTGLTFKTGAEVFQEGLKYNGNFSWSVGNGLVSNSKAGTHNITSGYKAGHSLRTGSARNTIYGPFAGELMGSVTIGNILIGAYAGNQNQDNNKFYLDNVLYTDYETEKASSFLYADLETERRLYIRDRLAVSKEGKFGTSGLTDEEGEYGMYQMSAAENGIPQWHDGTEWKDFANSTDTYLNDYDLTGNNLTLILSDLTEIGPIDLSGVNTITFATSPSSPATGKTAASDYGYVQISNSSFTNNEGITYKEGLRWLNTTLELLVPGALNIASFTTDSGFNNRSIWSDGDHAYIKLNGTSIQIDNEPNPIDTIDGENIGGATYEVFKQRVGTDLQFRTFRSMPIHSTLNPNDRVSMSFSADGDAIFIGTTAEKNRLDSQPDNAFNDVVLDRDNSGETLLIRALRPGTGVTLTQHEEYILIDSTGAGGGEVNTMDNNGSGIEFYAAKNGAEFEMYTLSTTDTRITLTQATNYSTDPENTINLDLGFDSTDAAVVGAGEASLKPTITGTGVTGDLYTFTHKKLTSPLSSIVITETATEIQVESGSAAATGTNLGTGVDIYVDSSAPDFEFKSLTASGDHHIVEANADGLHIDILVDDISTDFIGRGEQLFSMAANQWDSIQKGIDVTAASGLTLSTVVDGSFADIVIDQPILIPGFNFVETPSFTPGSPIVISGSTGLLEFTVDYLDDVRGGGSLVNETLFQVNIGTGLLYDSVTNTLYANTTGGSSGDDFALREVGYSDTSTERTYTLTVKDTLGTVEDTYNIEIPFYQLPIAGETDYTGAAGSIGGVKVEEYIAGWVLGNTVPLTLDTPTGKLAANKLIVTYEQQNNLHDEDNDGETLSIPPGTELDINILRTNARANIGAAYVEGSENEDFYTKDIIVAGAIDASENPQTTVHTIGALTIQRFTIGTVESYVVIEQNSGTKIELNPQTLNLVVNGDPGTRRINLKHGTTTKFRFDMAAGDLYVKGNIYAQGDIIAYSPEITL